MRSVGRGGRSAELVKKANLKRDCFLWDLIESCSQDLTGTVDRTEWIDDTEKTKNTYDSRRRRECFVYAILEGMCRLIASMDAEKLKKNTQGKELIDLAKSAFEVARESQERVYWVADGTFSWAAIEGSEKLHLTDEMLRAYKGGAKLNREKLFKLMRRKRIEYMTKFMKTDGASSSNKNSSKELSKLRAEILSSRGRLERRRIPTRQACSTNGASGASVRSAQDSYARQRRLHLQISEQEAADSAVQETLSADGRRRQYQ